MDFAMLLHRAIEKAGKQEILAAELGLASSALSRRISGEVGWQEKELNSLLEYAGCKIVDQAESKKKIEALKETLRIILGE